MFASGLHGQNGLDSLTSFHLIKIIYILPVLLYGLEIVQLNKGQLDQLKLYQKKLIKHVVLVHTNTTDTAMYILSGLLPNEAQLDKKKKKKNKNKKKKTQKTFCNNVCSSIQKRLAVRQNNTQVN